ncbi:MAG: S-methyl-5'-thioadenosine phosphorylase [Candidatus Hodarchaeota archaeon]
MAEIAVIGGSGFYDFLSESTKKTIQTPYGQVQVLLGSIGQQKVIFIPRHGTSHSIPPHKVNYKANIHALYQIGVERIFTSSAVGSCRLEFKAGDFMLLSSFLDLFRGSSITFFDGSTTIAGKNGKEISGVVHTDVSDPYCPQLRDLIFQTSKTLDIPVHSSGVYAMSRGPRFETPAEIEALRRLGADVVGMTNVPEVVLARELGMCYVTVAVITNYAAGMQERITHEEVTETFNRRISALKSLLEKTIEKLPSEKQCDC